MKADSDDEQQGRSTMARWAAVAVAVVAVLGALWFVAVAMSLRCMAGSC